MGKMEEPFSAETARPGWGAASEAPRILGVGVCALDQRRVDVAVDLACCPEPLNVELVIVGPDDRELCSMLVVHTRERMLDKIMHLRSDAKPGEHILHVGLFRDEDVLDQVARRFVFSSPDSGPGG